MAIHIHAHGKINWSLNILAPRNDGYHELDMLMQSLALHDNITMEDAPELELIIDGRALPAGEKNLILRAAEALNEYTDQRRGARIQLEKRIPVRAGLGGGSADCAAALVALNRLWDLDLSMEALMKIGRRLGSDVPFCLQGGLVRVAGVGEKLRPIQGAPEIPLAMVTPGCGLSTPEVFKKWDEGRYPITLTDLDGLARELTVGHLDRVQEMSFNALEAPALKMLPEIGQAMEAFRRLGARVVRMSGSGSTVFGAFDTPEQAQAAAEQIPGAITTHTLGD